MGQTYGNTATLHKNGHIFLYGMAAYKITIHGFPVVAVIDTYFTHIKSSVVSRSVDLNL